MSSFTVIDRIFQQSIFSLLEGAITHLLKEYRISWSKHRWRSSRNKW